jgi:hypothetical protein
MFMLLEANGFNHVFCFQFSWNVGSTRRQHQYMLVSLWYSVPIVAVTYSTFDVFFLLACSHVSTLCILCSIFEQVIWWAKVELMFEPQKLPTEDIIDIVQVIGNYCKSDCLYFTFHGIIHHVVLFILWDRCCGITIRFGCLKIQVDHMVSITITFKGSIEG